MEEKQNRAGDEDVDNILTVSSFQEDGQVVVTISDTGLGISDEAKSRIFEPFFTTKPHGVGMGLAVVHRIVTSHGGTVNMDSTPGSGTSVTLTFPRHMEQEEQRYEQHSEEVLLHASPASSCS